MTGVIVALILFSILTAMLFLPLVIYADSRSGLFYIAWKGILRAAIILSEKDLIKLRFRIFFISFNFYPLRSSTRKKKKNTEIAKHETKAEKKKRKQNIGIGKIFRLVGTFRVKQLSLKMDTGNYVTNGLLYPVFQALSRGPVSMNINFNNTNELVLDIRNRPIRLIRAFITR